MLRISAEEYAALTGQNLPKKKSRPSVPKYRNRRVYVYKDGFVANIKTDSHGTLKETFDSQKEYTRCIELRLLERAGKISGLKLQVPLVIQESFVDAAGKKQKAVVYRADFMYEEGGRVIVEDVKGVDKRTGKPVCTEAFKLKWKFLKKKYGDYVFRIY